MARTIRLDYPDTYYHILSRGNERRKIFRSKEDFQLFLDLLDKMSRRFHIEVHAFVLMSNHYHLLVRTRQANLSKSIQWLGLTYSIHFNLRHNRVGHLFQGRFKSFVIEDDRYFASMCMYIHRNPIRAGIVNNIGEYPWSSYPVYAGRMKLPWLTTHLVKNFFEGKTDRLINAHDRFAGNEPTFLRNLRHGLFLGDEDFPATWEKRLEMELDREKPQGRDILRGKGIHEITAKAFSRLGVDDWTEFLKPLRRRNRPERDLVIYILSNLARFSNQQIGREFGVGYTAIPGALQRAEKLLAEDRRLWGMVKDILNDI